MDSPETPFVPVSLDAVDDRFDLYRPGGFNELVIDTEGSPYTSLFGTFTLTITVDDAVPELGTWALMLVGFGVLGTALRARRAGSGGEALRRRNAM